MNEKIAYKIMSLQDDGVAYDEDSGLSIDLKNNQIIDSASNGIAVSVDKEDAFDNYAGNAEVEVVVSFEYDSSDIVSGNDEDPYAEFTLKDAKPIGHEMIIDDQIVELNPNRPEEIYANKMFTSIEGWVGNGDNGHVYETSDGRIIKVTNALDEMYMASKLIGVEHDHVVNVYDVDMIGSYMFILMEKVETGDEIEYLFEEIMEEVAEQGCDLTTVDPDENLTGMSDEAMVMLEEIQAGIVEIQETARLNPMDIKGDNIGRNASGNYVLFDQFDRSHTPKNEIQEFLTNKIAEKQNSRSKRLNRP